MSRQRPTFAAFTVAGILVAFLLVGVGCQATPQRAPMLDPAANDSGRPLVATPLPRELAEMEQASRAAEAGGDASNEDIERPARSEQPGAGAVSWPSPPAPDSPSEPQDSNVVDARSPQVPDHGAEAAEPPESGHAAAESPAAPADSTPPLPEETPAAPAPAAETAGDSEDVGPPPSPAGSDTPPAQEPLPRRPSAVAFADIPDLPTPPPDTRARPEGVVRAPKGEPDKPAEVRGQWRQVDKDHGSDFLPGGYESSTFLFRPEGIVEVQRIFGKGGAISQTWRIGYEWNKDKSVLTLGRDPGLRPAPQSLQGFSAGDVVVRAPVRSFPIALHCVRSKDGTVRLGDKVYAQLSEGGDKPSGKDSQTEKKGQPGESSSPRG